MIGRSLIGIQRIDILAVLLIVLLVCGCGGGGEGTDQFSVDTSNLTTPELVDAYQHDNFQYGSSSEGYGCGGIDIGKRALDCPPRYIYGTKRGNCGAFTSFALFCLEQAGFEAYPLRVYSQWPDDFAPYANPRNYHYIALYKDQGQWYIMDNGRGNGIQRGIDGPFAEIDDIPYTILDIEGYIGWP